MIEVAIVSMEEALRADGEAQPDGSGTLERHPIELPGLDVAGDAEPRTGSGRHVPSRAADALVGETPSLDPQSSAVSRSTGA
jgi:hypothetical protein